MKILIIDSSKDLSLQFARISKDTGILISDLRSAWQNAHPTVTKQSTFSDIIFEEMKPEVYKPEKKLSFVAQQKYLPKFMR